MPFTNHERLLLQKECGKVMGSLLALTTMLATEGLIEVQVAQQADHVRDEAEALFQKIQAAVA